MTWPSSSAVSSTFRSMGLPHIGQINFFSPDRSCVVTEAEFSKALRDCLYAVHLWRESDGMDGCAQVGLRLEYVYLYAPQMLDMQKAFRHFPQAHFWPTSE